MSKRARGEATEFLRMLWPGGLPPGGHIVIVAKRQHGSKPTMHPSFFDDVGKAADYATQSGKHADTYVGMAAQPKVEGRGTTESALAIPGLWLDFDFEKGFQDDATVRAFIAALPMAPSVLVHSGGGVHAHWLFREWLDTSGDAAVAATGLTLGWLRYCREVARLRLRAELDAVADLARVMRVPGTLNFKRDQPRNVTLHVWGGTVDDPQRYNPSDFESWRVETSSRSAVYRGSMDDFVVREGAQPPVDKWMVAVDNIPDIKAVWEHTKRMPVDSSVSGYDLALATRLDRIGWTAQEIVDTLVAHRAKYSGQITDAATSKDPLHLRNPAYYERLLRKARGANERERANEEAVQLAEDTLEEMAALGPAAAPDPETRAKWMRAVSEHVGVEVVDIWTVDRTEAPWNVRIVGSEGEHIDIPATSPDQLLQWPWWVRLIMRSGTRRDTAIPARPQPLFRDLCSRAGAIVRVTAGNATKQDELAEYLWEVAQEAPSYETASVTSRMPFIKEDSGPLGIKDWGEPTKCLFVAASYLTYDMRMGHCPKVDRLSHALLELGFVRRTVAARNNEDAPTTRGYFCLSLVLLQRAAEKARQRGVGVVENEREEGEDATTH